MTFTTVIKLRIFENKVWRKLCATKLRQWLILTQGFGRGNLTGITRVDVNGNSN